MKESGYDPSSYVWEEEYYDELRALRDRSFARCVFTTMPSLVARRVVNGHREERPYEGQDFDTNEFELVEAHWDHEHCFVCRFRIEPGHSYWKNSSDYFLCDQCAGYIERTRGFEGGSDGA